MDHRTEADLFEGEVEYDRLAAALSWPATERFARLLHSGQTHPTGVPRLRHCYAVAELAARHARKLPGGDDFFAQRYREMVCRHAGLLHESMDVGSSFEDVVAAADEAVARAVASLSPDRRAPRPRRLRLYANQLGLASLAAQAVKLADLQHDCLLMTETGARVEGWFEEAREALSSLGRIQAVPDLEPLARRLRVDVAVLEGPDKKARGR